MIKQLTQIEICPVEQLPIQAGTSIQINNQEIALFRLTNNEVYAIENKSPHPKGGVLAEGLVSGNYVFCPVYDWKISLIDGQVQSPDEGQVKTFPIEIIEGNVYIQV